MTIRSHVFTLLLVPLTACAPASYETHHFASSQELAAVVERAGWTCVGADDEEKTDQSLAKYGFDSAPCNRGAIVLWASDAKRDELTSLPQNTLKPGEVRLVGGNWSVTGDQYLVEDAQKELGGAIAGD